MNLNELYPFAEDRKSRKRVGRGSAVSYTHLTLPTIA